MDSIKLYDVYLVHGLVAVGVGFATKKLLRLETINVQNLKSGATSLATVAASTYFAEKVIEQMEKQRPLQGPARKPI